MNCIALSASYAVQGWIEGGLVGFERTPLFADLLVFIITSSVLNTQRLSANHVRLQPIIARINVALGLVQNIRARNSRMPNQQVKWAW